MEIQKDISKDTSVSSKTEYSAYNNLNKRTEKLITALHMVTDFMGKDEPARNRLRVLGIKLVSDIHTGRADLGQLSATTISEIMSLINISTSVGLISDMNGNILVREFLGLKNSIEDDNSSENIIGKYIADQELNALSQPFKSPLISSRTFNKGQNIMSNKNANVFYKSNDKVSTNSSRRESVLKLIKEKGQVTIKDISSVISDCSEKTIQRELISLLNDKIIEKIGEKRWSRYFIKV